MRTSSNRFNILTSINEEKIGPFKERVKFLKSKGVWTFYSGLSKQRRNDPTYKHSPHTTGVFGIWRDLRAFLHGP